VRESRREGKKGVERSIKRRGDKEKKVKKGVRE